MKRGFVLFILFLFFSCSFDKATNLYNSANKFYGDKRYEQSIELYEEAISYSKNSDFLSDAYYNLGNAYFMNAIYESVSDSSDKYSDKDNKKIEISKENLEQNNNEDKKRENIDVDSLLSALESYKRSELLSSKDNSFIAYNAQIVRLYLEKIEEQKKEEEQKKQEEKNKDKKEEKEDKNSKKNDKSGKNGEEKNSNSQNTQKENSQQENSSQQNSEMQNTSMHEKEEKEGVNKLSEEEAAKLNEALKLIDEEQLNKMQRQSFSKQNKKISVDKDW